MKLNETEKLFMIGMFIKSAHMRMPWQQDRDDSWEAPARSIGLGGIGAGGGYSLGEHISKQIGSRVTNLLNKDLQIPNSVPIRGDELMRRLKQQILNRQNAGVVAEDAAKILRPSVGVAGAGTGLLLAHLINKHRQQQGH